MELSEAINSMMKWYDSAQVCYVYLSDVPTAEEDPYIPRSSFRRSQWFSRGWALQELLAPNQVEFYDQNWEEIGTKRSLEDLIKLITGISRIFNYREASVAEKMSWASARETTIIEDEAYCLLGIFDINMPLLYGEGRKAFTRLQIEIVNSSEDDSIFAWEGYAGCGLLAPSPAMFRRSHDIFRALDDPQRHQHSASPKGVRLESFTTRFSTKNFKLSKSKTILFPMNCARLVVSKVDSRVESLALELYKDESETVWRRDSWRRKNKLALISKHDYSFGDRKTFYVPQTRWAQLEGHESLPDYQRPSIPVFVEFPSLSQYSMYLSEKLTSKKEVTWVENGADQIRMCFEGGNWGDGLLQFRSKTLREIPTFTLIISPVPNQIRLDIIYLEAPLSQIKIPWATGDTVRKTDRIVKPFPSGLRGSIRATLRMKRIDGESCPVVTVVCEKTETPSWQTEKAIGQ
jgi:hypothetical protein